MHANDNLVRQSEKIQKTQLIKYMQELLLPFLFNIFPQEWALLN